MGFQGRAQKSQELDPNSQICAALTDISYTLCSVDTAHLHWQAAESLLLLLNLQFCIVHSTDALKRDGSAQHVQFLFKRFVPELHLNHWLVVGMLP